MSTLATVRAGLLLAAGHAQARQAGEVTVYRCVDAKGHVTLGDVPCPAGSSGEARTMQRPQDAPERPRPAVVVAPTAEVQPAPAPQLVMLRPPQPMYECIAPDGSRYTSDTADGRPRWVPRWTRGYRSRGRPVAGPSRPATNALGQYHAGRPLGGYVGAPTATAPPPTAGPQRPGPRPPTYPVGTPGTWVQDTCHALPPAEVCARLRDRRDEIRRRFFNAQETERSALRVEERGINARLDSDCR